ncbi:MAG: ATP-binding cassette domain-containing protein [Bacillus subtilis]|nr:ATP-binding cassette domain-containing protein [Bacillus subtilis]
MIRIDHGYKQYKTSQGIVQALDDVSFSVEQGEIFAIIGMSGAGKSTLLKILIWIGNDRSRNRLDGRKRSIGIPRKRRGEAFAKGSESSFKDRSCFHNELCLKNIAFPLEIANIDAKKSMRAVDELLRTVGLLEKKDQYPKHLSGGQLQRVAIARALASRPEVLLLDEPTSALDSLTTEGIIDLVRKINREEALTVVVISHDIGVVRRLSDRVLVLENGRVSRTRGNEVGI